jgi:hypothetical protein
MRLTSSGQLTKSATSDVIPKFTKNSPLAAVRMNTKFACPEMIIDFPLSVVDALAWPTFRDALQYLEVWSGQFRNPRNVRSR